jgi:pimeloyl-ACP methyl ester carboxylesterase
LPEAVRRRRLLLAAGLVLGTALVVVTGISWVFSNGLLDPEHKAGPFDVEVRAVAADRVTLERTEESGRDGVFGIDWRDGHAIVGRVLERRSGSVTRELSGVQGRLSRGVRVNVDSNVWESDPQAALGIPFRDVKFRTPLRRMPAWHVPGGRGTWALFVHGRNADRYEGLRDLPSLRRARLPTLLITYRNDVGAQPAPDGLIHLGNTEWRDLESAAAFALSRGARNFVLIGDSMGGAIVTQFIQRSRLGRRVRGLVLDSPVLDWGAVLDLQARERGLPGFITRTTEWTVKARIGIDWSRFDQVRRAHRFQVPILLFHGTEDRTVPVETSDRFARRLPRLVEYVRVPRAGHVQSWNVDRQRYEAKLTRFLQRVGG